MKRVLKKRQKDLIFYCLMIALPLLQYAIFYVGVNMNSILLAFQKYEMQGYSYKFVFVANFDNFKNVFVDLFTTPIMIQILKNTTTIYLLSLFVVTPLALIFSFYIMKKLPGSGLFRVILFIPTIICSVILVYIFQIIADNIVPNIATSIIGDDTKYDKFQLLVNADTRFGAIVFFGMFLSFGVNVLMYSGAMSSVSDDIIEAAHLDGCGDFKEFIHIILPSVFPTLTTFIIIGIANFFINQAHLFDLYGAHAESSIQTLGYFMFAKAAPFGGEIDYASYPYLSAMGLIFTLFAAPVTFFVKWALEKFGPNPN